MPADYSQTYLERWRQQGADTLLTSLCSDERIRVNACKRVAETILAANSLNPHSWGLTQAAWGLRLNFGRLEAISWGTDEIRIMVDFQSAPTKVVLKKLENLRSDDGIYRSAPDSHYVWSNTTDAAEFDSFLQLVAAPHAAHLRVAAGTGINGVTPKGHHPGFVDAIALVAGIALPQPDYVVVARPLDAALSITPLASATGGPAEPAASMVPAVTFEEGAARDVIQTAVERDPRARQACLDHYGTACAVCGIRLEERYGDAARGLIHVHHLVPLSSGAGVRSTDPIEDLRPVCPNCHAVIHRRVEPYTIEEVRTMVEKGFGVGVSRNP